LVDRRFQWHRLCQGVPAVDCIIRAAASGENRSENERHEELVSSAKMTSS